MSTTEKGNDLRDKVFNLLHGLNKKDIEKEKRVGGKKADVYYVEKGTFGENIRCVIECKNYSKKLSNTDIKKIIVEYFVEKKHFDRLFILTKLEFELTPAIQDTLEEHKYLIVCSFSKFLGLLINFNQYLLSSRLLFKDEGLNKYYVPLRDEDEKDLSLLIDNWIDSDTHRPVSILAGYGMGKTCFALNLVEKYAGELLEGGVGRIPIYIRLGEIVDKTSIESLICTMFSSTYSVENFTYPIFKELNRLGFFIIIYDGFDEMKHAMTASIFQAMIMDLNSLVEKKSKVLLLGRQNSFLSESEQESVLHGVVDLNQLQIKDPDLVDYREIYIKEFGKDQIKKFLENYLLYLQSEKITSDNEMGTKAFYEKRLNELLSESYDDLIKRPVHAKMLAKLSFSTTENLNIIGRFQLYKQFIRMFFNRESKKTAREGLSVSLRVSFIQDVAWRLWKENGRRNFSSNELDGWVKDYFSRDDLSRNVNMLRELITGSILERKQNDYYYFSHRSFQEFLVASFFLDKQSLTPGDLENISKSINLEIMEFMLEGDVDDSFIRKVYEAIKIYHGYLSNVIVRNIIRKLDNLRINTSDVFQYSPWNTYILSSSFEVSVIIESLVRSVLNIEENRVINNLACMFALLKRQDSKQNMSQLFSTIVNLMHVLCIEEIHQIQINRGRIISGIGTEDVAKRSIFMVLLKTANPSINEDEIEAHSVVFNGKLFVDAIRQELKQFIELDDVIVLELASIKIDYITVQVSSMKDYIKSYNEQQLQLNQNNLYMQDENKIEESVRKSMKKIRRFWGAKPVVTDVIPITKIKNETRPRLGLKRN